MTEPVDRLRQLHALSPWRFQDIDGINSDHGQEDKILALVDAMAALPALLAAYGELTDLRAEVAAAHDVIRRYRDGWKPGKNMAVVTAGSPRPDPEPIWMSVEYRRDAEPMTPAEKAALDAAAGPDDPTEWLSLRCGFCGHWEKGQFTKDRMADWLRVHRNAGISPNEGHTTTASTCPHPCGTPLAGPDDTEEDSP